jgi:hypothetical protein
MEGGTRMDATRLQQLWQQNLRDFIPDRLHLKPEDVPTLVELERAFRRVKAGKAIGADDIPPELCHGQPATLASLTFTQVFKLVAHGQEALVHKGGLLVSAWKRERNMTAAHTALSSSAPTLVKLSTEPSENNNPASTNNFFKEAR